MVTPLTCWKCGFNRRSDDGTCLQCGADWYHPPRQPTEAEAAPWGRAQGGGNPLMGKHKVNRGVVKTAFSD